MSLKSQIFTADGTFTVGASVSAVMLQLIGPGGGARGQNGIGFGQGGNGGSAGEFALNVFTPVTPGATVAVTVGTGGTGALGNANPGGGIGNASFGNVLALPGRDNNSGYPSAPAGNGGGIGGADAHNQGNNALGTPESITYFGGCAGRGGVGRTSVQIPSNYIGYCNADTCGGQPGFWDAAHDPPGTGGSTAVWPTGGTGGVGDKPSTSTPATDGVAASGYGAGGGGAGDGESFGGPHSGGNGGKGAVVVYWMEP